MKVACKKRVYIGFMLIALLMISVGVLAQNNPVEVTIVLTQDNGENPVTYIFRTQGNESLFQLMQRKFVIAHTNGFIDSIQGKASSNEKSTAWFYTINGNMAMVGADAYSYKNGDLINWDLRSWR